MVRVILGVSVGRAVSDAVGLGPVAVGKGPIRACCVRAMAVLVLLAFCGFPLPDGLRNADARRTMRPINTVHAAKAFR